MAGDIEKKMGDGRAAYGEGRFAHGGDVVRLAARAGCGPDQLVDFSVNVNPLGPPPWLAREAALALDHVERYPEPRASGLVLAASQLYRVPPSQIVPGNGASELLLAAVAHLADQGVSRAVIPVPAYVDYARACELHGLRVQEIRLSPDDGFEVDFVRIRAALAESSAPAAVFLCQPNNPTGVGFDADEVRVLADDFPHCRFVVDESFADFAPGLDRMIAFRPGNAIILHSLTKFFAIPGLRVGLLYAVSAVAEEIRRRLPEWSVNGVAQRVGAACLRDTEYQLQGIDAVRVLREELVEDLQEIPALRVFPSNANFLLCRYMRVGQTAETLADKLLEKRIVIRTCGNFAGLDDSYLRIAVLDEARNAQLVDSLREISGLDPVKRVSAPARTPALMIQGASSNAGKSVLTAALCRILLRDGYKVAPFKAQNMSNNSYVADGGEMGRAQVVQAQACRREPDVRMNPVLLKPNTDTGSQVVVGGKVVGVMSVREYHTYKPEAFRAVQRAYDSLAEENEVMVIEGAGSPAEINLKQHDIVNMRMAEYADARVLLAGDIDRGGVFAALVGTMSLLEEHERERVFGYVLNRFRGDASLLDPALDEMLRRTGRPVLGVVPHIESLGLPEEDSVSFKEALGSCTLPESGKLPPEQCVEIVCLDLARIANFNDLDPLRGEPDVRLRVVGSPLDIGVPDMLVLPGSKSTISDMRALRGAGFAAVLRELASGGRTEIIGICGGFQMLGETVADPLRLELDRLDPLGEAEGFGLLPLRTVLAAEKTLCRTSARFVGEGSCADLGVTGYEIHHGVTEPLADDLRPVVAAPNGEPLGYGFGRVWGTYLHGIFDDDLFRRRFLDGLRGRRGLEPLGAPQTCYDVDAAIDRVADVVREALDMDAIYRALGLR